MYTLYYIYRVTRSLRREICSRGADLRRQFSSNGAARKRRGMFVISEAKNSIKLFSFRRRRRVKACAFPRDYDLRYIRGFK